MTFVIIAMNGATGVSGISGWLDIYFIFMLQWEARFVDVREVVPCEAAGEGETGLVVFEMDDVHAGMGDGEGTPEEMRRDAQQIGEPAHREAFMAEQRDPLIVGVDDFVVVSGLFVAETAEEIVRCGADAVVARFRIVFAFEILEAVAVAPIRIAVVVFSFMETEAGDGEEPAFFLVEFRIEERKLAPRKVFRCPVFRFDRNAEQFGGRSCGILRTTEGGGEYAVESMDGKPSGDGFGLAFSFRRQRIRIVDGIAVANDIEKHVSG